MTASAALRWPVTSRWKIARGQGSVALLSSTQRAVLLYVAWLTRKGAGRGNRRTLEEMCKALGLSVNQRGQVSEELWRLRQLNLIGFETRLGSKGFHRLWLDRGSARARAVRQAQRAANDRTSTPFGGFITARGVEAAWRRRRRPPSRAGASARDGPRRGTRPPQVINARCPVGHPTRLGRRSWMAAPDGFLLRAEWTGVCRRCGDRPMREVVELEAVVAPPRELSPAELADPELLERRRRMAALYATEGHRVDERTIRTYLDERPTSTSTSGPLANDVDRLIRRRPPQEPPGAGGQS